MNKLISNNLVTTKNVVIQLKKKKIYDDISKYVALQGLCCVENRNCKF